MSCAGCATIHDLRSPEKGSLENPICSDGPHAQRLYLRRLRLDDGRRIAYEREAPIMGPQRRILDPYRIWPDDGNVLASIQLLFIDTDPRRPGSPLQQRIFLDMYRPGCMESDPPPGFKLADSEE